ncbi:hypothetical protein KSP40_PGU012038 [Platanthera guangdongensis]|uniref:Uncharacterized protein n=1 Tax=Platanthera guangdongensis TaxID=2320717 RepID=A0ABR2LZC4_9ASPA
MRETVPSYPDLVYRVEAQIAADEAIEAHRRQFEDATKRKREEATSRSQEERQLNPRQQERRKD